jgi:hypothetical protein
MPHIDRSTVLADGLRRVNFTQYSNFTWLLKLTWQIGVAVR